MIKRVTLTQDEIELLINLLDEELAEDVAKSQKGEMTTGEYKRKRDLCQATERALEHGIPV